MKIRAAGAAQLARAARATTLLTSPGPDRATANRPPKPGRPRAPARSGTIRHKSRPPRCVEGFASWGHTIRHTSP